MQLGDDDVMIVVNDNEATPTRINKVQSQHAYAYGACWMCAGVVSVCVDHGHVFRAISEAAPLDERLEEAWSGFMERWDDAVTARILSEQEQGLIGPCDAPALARALNMLDAAVLISEFGRRPQGDPKAVTETLFRIWQRTLYGP